MNIVFEIVTRVHRLLGAVVVVLAATAAVVLIAPAARADEFVVGIVVDSATDSSAGAAFVDGFRLAVDQSPDISHPLNTEGGDHLGGMDVVLVVVDDSSEKGALVDGVVDFVGANSVPILVVDVAQDVLASLVGPVSDRGTMVIAVADGGGGLSGTTPLFFVAGRADVAGLLTDRSPGFEDAFSSQYARPSSPAATRGYLAGRLVDLSVEATDMDPFDAETLVAALVEASNPRPAIVDVVDVAEKDRAPTGPVGASVGDAGSAAGAIAVVGLMVAAAVHVYWAAGGKWPGRDRSDLARKVVGSTDVFPSTVMTLGVAVSLAIAAIVVGGAVGLWALPVSQTVVRGVSWIVAAVMLGRGLVGLVLSGRRQATGRSTPFSIRDVVVYSPLTLVFGALIVFSLASSR